MGHVIPFRAKATKPKETLIYSPLTDQWVPWVMIERATTTRVLDAIYLKEVSP